MKKDTTMIKKIITSTFASILLLPSAAFAQSAPGVAYKWINTPYGQFGCFTRAENKLYSIGATSVQKTTTSVFGIVNNSRVAVWCRGSEAIIFVAGPNDVAPIRDEVATAF